MKYFTLLVASLLLGVPGRAAITNLANFSFDDIGDPWAGTGEVSFENHIGAPVLTDDVARVGDGKAGILDGTVYAHGTDFSGTLTGHYGVHLWLKNPSIVGDGDTVVVASIGDPSADGISLVFNQSQGGYFSVMSNGYGAGGGLFNVAHALDQWTHVAMVYDGSIFIYIDGVLAGYVGVPVTYPTSDWYLFGSSLTSPVLAGEVDDVQLFSFQVGEFVATDDLSFYAIPEPATLGLVLAATVLALAAWQRTSRA